MICNEKRRKIDDNLLSTPNANNEIVKPIEKQVLEILNTPLVEKAIASPSVTSYSSILKVHILVIHNIHNFIQLCFMAILQNFKCSMLGNICNR